MTAREPLLVYGAGGHGLVVAEAAHAAGFEPMGFIDDAAPPALAVGRWPVLGGGDMAEEIATSADARVIIAIGDNSTRFQTQRRLASRGLSLATIIHPSAQVSPSAHVHAGAFIGPLAVVHAEAVVWAGAIVNSAAVVEHHGQVGDASHVAPGAVLTGRVTVGARALVGARAVVLPGVKIGDDAIVGAGAVVLCDVAAGQTVAGNPARVISQGAVDEPRPA